MKLQVMKYDKISIWGLVIFNFTKETSYNIQSRPWHSFLSRSGGSLVRRILVWGNYYHCIAPGVHSHLSNGFTFLILRSKISLISLHPTFFAAPSQYFESAAGTSTTQLDRGSLLHQKDFQTSRIQKICTKPNSQTVQNREPHPTLLTKSNICAIITSNNKRTNIPCGPCALRCCGQGSRCWACRLKNALPSKPNNRA